MILVVMWTLFGAVQNYSVPMDSAEACEKARASYTASGFAANIRAAGGEVTAYCK